MAQVLDAEWLKCAETLQVFSLLKACGHEARIVGGAVRNTLIGEPVADIDFATTARPAEVVACADKENLRTIPTGIAHGTVTLMVDGHPFEITTLRRDVETDGRHAVVAYTTDWHADAARRDFTMNALYTNADGEIFDPVGGLEDAKNRRVRFIGDAGARIREDYLRILRFFRFNAQYGKEVFDEAGLSACVRERAGLARLSAERVRDEVFKLLTAPRAFGALSKMFDYGLLVDILGRVPRLYDFAKLTGLEAHLGKPPDPVLRLGALALWTPADPRHLATRFRLSNAEKKRLKKMAAADPIISAETGGRAARAALYRLSLQVWRDRVLLLWARAGGALDDPRWRALYELPDRWQIPVFPVDGRDVIARGVSQSPQLGDVLKRLEAWWIEQDFPSSHSRIDRKLDELVAMTGTDASSRGDRRA